MEQEIVEVLKEISRRLLVLVVVLGALVGAVISKRMK